VAQRRGATSGSVRAERLPAGSSRTNSAGWRHLVGPVLLLSALSAVAIVFIASCARESELDLQVRVARGQVERLRAEHQSLCAQINEARDPAALRRIALTDGMVFTPAGVDHVKVSRALPPAQVELSPLAELPLPSEPSPSPVTPKALARVGSPEAQ
jgi:hypothetical protein